MMAFLLFPPGLRPYGPEAKAPMLVFSATYLRPALAQQVGACGFPLL